MITLLEFVQSWILVTYFRYGVKDIILNSQWAFKNTCHFQFVAITDSKLCGMVTLEVRPNFFTFCLCLSLFTH